MTETPQTDSQNFGECCATDFARTLERKLASATARIAELETANRELLHAMMAISDMWIVETTPSSPPDALAERMAKLALAATLRKHP